VKLFNILVHVLTETSRHAGHADILREQLDGSTGFMAEYADAQPDAAFLGSSARDDRTGRQSSRHLARSRSRKTAQTRSDRTLTLQAAGQHLIIRNLRLDATSGIEGTQRVEYDADHRTACEGWPPLPAFLRQDSSSWRADVAEERLTRRSWTPLNG
jgi:hypothetical protein